MAYSKAMKMSEQLLPPCDIHEFHKIIWSERNQTQKDTYWSHLYKVKSWPNYFMVLEVTCGKEGRVVTGRDSEGFWDTSNDLILDLSDSYECSLCYNLLTCKLQLCAFSHMSGIL